MKRYLLFASYDYYPSGGWDDFYGAYDTMSEVMEAIKQILATGDVYTRKDWWHYVDTEKMTITGGGNR